MTEYTTARIRAAGDAAALQGEAGTGVGWGRGGTALVMLASVIAYGVMASGCAGVCAAPRAQGVGARRVARPGMPRAAWAARTIRRVTRAGTACGRGAGAGR